MDMLLPRFSKLLREVEKRKGLKEADRIMDFIEECVRFELLVEESEKCKDLQYE